MNIREFFDIEKTKSLLESKADPDKFSGGICNTTPLHHASYSGKKELVKILLESKADPNNMILGVDSTPLHSFIKGYERVCSKYLALKISENEFEKSTNELMDIAKILLEYKADPTLENSYDERPLDDILVQETIRQQTEIEEYKKALSLFNCQKKTLIFGLSNTSSAEGTNVDGQKMKNELRPLRRFFSSSPLYDKKNLIKQIAAFLEPQNPTKRTL